MKHENLTEKIIGIFYDVYNELGFGFLESVYEKAMMLALSQSGLNVKQQVPIPVWFRGKEIGHFEADIIVNQLIIIELKAVSMLQQVHTAQLLNYLRATDVEVGLLLNFGNQPRFKRMAFDNDRIEKRRESGRMLSNLLSSK